ncbi:MAG: HNH endonuclease [Methanosarcinales archaeon]|nr:HNH endonuclease [Methanosarcinales archaeon]
MQLQEQIRERSHFLCEYCHTSEKWQYVPFTVDHIIPVTRGGTNTQENLALACFHCNRRKGRRVTGMDPDSGKEVSLFHPRQHLWREHFIWSTDRFYLMGLTPIGRATVEALELNRERVIRIRAADLAVGRHPPIDDPVHG